MSGCLDDEVKVIAGDYDVELVFNLRCSFPNRTEAMSSIETLNLLIDATVWEIEGSAYDIVKHREPINETDGNS